MWLEIRCIAQHIRSGEHANKRARAFILFAGDEADIHISSSPANVGFSCKRGWRFADLARRLRQQAA